MVQWIREPWVDKQALHRGLEHLGAFRALESLILAGITNRPIQGCNPVEALADGFETIAPSIKTVKLVHWKVSPMALIEFICRFPSLDNLIIEDTRYLVGLPDWKRPSKFPRFAGRFELTDSNGHGSAERALHLLPGLPLGFRKISIDAGFTGTPDDIIAILEKCSPVLVRASLYYGYRPSMATVPLSFMAEPLPKRSITMTNFLGATIREINASFPELRELILEPDPERRPEPRSETSIGHLLPPPLPPHAQSHRSLQFRPNRHETNKRREADRTMFELTQGIGWKVSFSWYFAYGVADIE